MMRRRGSYRHAHQGPLSGSPGIVKQARQAPITDRPAGSVGSPTALPKGQRQAGPRTGFNAAGAAQAPSLTSPCSTCAKCAPSFPRHQNNMCVPAVSGSEGSSEVWSVTGQGWTGPPPLQPPCLLQAASTALGPASPPASPAAQGPTPSPARPAPHLKPGLDPSGPAAPQTPLPT